MCTEPIFDHEKLDVYGLELQLVAWTTDFLTEASQSPVSHRRDLLDQLDRACLSMLNTAEGNGKPQGLQRAKFFDDARGSALECAACLDAPWQSESQSPLESIPLRSSCSGLYQY